VTDPWRAQLQQLYASGVFGGNDGQGQAYAGPQTQQAYAMSGLNRLAQQPAPGGAPGEQPSGQWGMGGGGGGLGTGGGIAGTLAYLMEQARNQQAPGQVPGSPGQPQSQPVPYPYAPPMQPGTGGRVTIRPPGGGLLGRY
jgi:hypothetical protein